ncbi:phosphopantetheine-binding protein [Segniliparus rotundus DSM 44985]|uniref:Phosphopantetheine-binding protein n=1 Tax=Segniliparus rotundus (strain ATCC BAA-972 / CDC 1076 / CIP 108378 / DSM 44985 / JCM 13578) TaxID=640132 RepID=D6Z773_SEGRD|nr:acyl carrier protein [Segniliparus rotundus]ADG97803.1 phosphopantetheine-binding protein [Segniliparus rotundus DSM 44985]
MSTPGTADPDAVRAKATRIVAAMAAEPPQRPLEGADRLIDDLGFDSVRLIELTMALERAFGLAAHSPEQLVSVATVDDVVALVSGALGKKGAQ